MFSYLRRESYIVFFPHIARYQLPRLRLLMYILRLPGRLTYSKTLHYIRFNYRLLRVSRDFPFLYINTREKKQSRCLTKPRRKEIQSSCIYLRVYILTVESGKFTLRRGSTHERRKGGIKREEVDEKGALKSRRKARDEIGAAVCLSRSLRVRERS